MDAKGIAIVTVSTDTPAEIAAGRDKHGLQATMLADSELRVTDTFGLRNQGIHSGPPGKAKALPVPTTLLVAPTGQVRWLDQAENYQQRSKPDRVRAAIAEHVVRADDVREDVS